jgi:DNA-binding MarR family transcriptional regulator
MPPHSSSPRELQILEQIEANPDVTQANLADELGMAIGTVNFVVKRLVKKGYIRVKQLERRRLKYIITPAGIALRTKLALDSLNYSMRLYRETREQAKQLVSRVIRQGYLAVSIRGEGELADVVRLTCLEMNVEVRPNSRDDCWPVISIVGTGLKLGLPAAAEKQLQREA